MKKLSTLFLGLLALLISSCENSNTGLELQESTPKIEVSKKATNSGVVPYSFPGVPQELVERAMKEYGRNLPAVTVAFTYSRGNSDIKLEDSWRYSIYKTPNRNCIVGEQTEYLVQSQHGDGLTTINGFTFLEEEDLCGKGTYEVDNRQGGWFDYVCGPVDFSFKYEGKPVFKLVHLWCE